MRGITITLMIVGHLVPYASFPFNVIYSFHMPLFFLLSGFCSAASLLRADKLHFGKYFWKKIKAIYVPLLILRLLLNILLSNTAEMIASPLKFIYFPGDWFLQTLFWGDLLFFGYIALCRKFPHASVKFFLPAVWIVISTYVLDLSRIYGPIAHQYLPFYFGVLALCFSFMLIGYLLHAGSVRIEQLQYVETDDGKKRISIPFCVILCCFVAISLLYMSEVDFVNVSTTYIGNNYFMFFGFALLIIYLIYVASKLISRVPHLCSFLAFWGRNSLYVYIVHAFVHYSMNLIIEKLTGKLYTPMIDLPWYFALLYFVLDFVIIIPYILLHNKIKSVIKGLRRKPVQQ